MELKDFRRQYTQGGLQRASLPEQPLALFEQWQADAAAAGLADPTGCVVATVQPSGMVRQRFVLLKHHPAWLHGSDNTAGWDGASAFRVAEGRR